MNAASAQIIDWADYEGQTVILDFSGAPNEDWYKYNAELYLQDLFRYRQSCFPEKGEPAPMLIVSDEFQNMNTKKGAALEKILREGRKYGIALWLASQLVESDTGSKLKGITDQCSMKVYFMAGTERAKKIARMLSLSTSEKTKMQAQICSLKKREFVFQLNGNKPYKCITNEVKK